MLQQCPLESTQPSVSGYTCDCYSIRRAAWLRVNIATNSICIKSILFNIFSYSFWQSRRNWNIFYGQYTDLIWFEYNMGYREECWASFEELGIQTLYLLVVCSQMRQPRKWGELSLTNHCHSSRLANSNNIAIKKWRLQKPKNLPDYWAPRIFNSLENDIKLLPE